MCIRDSGYRVFDANTGRRLQTYLEDGNVNVSAKIEVDGYVGYLTNWSWNRLKLGQSWNFIIPMKKESHFSQRDIDIYTQTRNELFKNGFNIYDSKNGNLVKSQSKPEEVTLKARFEFRADQSENITPKWPSTIPD